MTFGSQYSNHSSTSPCSTADQDDLLVGAADVEQAGLDGLQVGVGHQSRDDLLDLADDQCSVFV